MRIPQQQRNPRRPLDAEWPQTLVDHHAAALLTIKRLKRLDVTAARMRELQAAKQDLKTFLAHWYGLYIGDTVVDPKNGEELEVVAFAITRTPGRPPGVFVKGRPPGTGKNLLYKWEWPS